MSLCLRDIRDAIRSLRMKGRNLNELKGLLINSNDMRELRHQVSHDVSFSKLESGSHHGGIKALGVDIFDSPYIQEGTIFKIFKTDDKLLAIPDENIGYMIPMPDHVKLPTMADTKREEEKQKRHSTTRKIELD